MRPCPSYGGGGRGTRSVSCAAASSSAPPSAPEARPGG